jgi:hypothetical protein
MIYIFGNCYVVCEIEMKEITTWRKLHKRGYMAQHPRLHGATSQTTWRNIPDYMAQHPRPHGATSQATWRNIPDYMAQHPRLHGATSQATWRNIPDYMAQHPRLQSSSYSPPWEPEISHGNAPSDSIGVS